MRDYNAVRKALGSVHSLLMKLKIQLMNRESYGGDTNTIWYDDIAVSGTRVGCNAA